MMWYWVGGPGHAGWVAAILGGLLWLLVVVLVVALIVRLVRGPRHRYWMQGPSGWTPGSHPDDPKQLLQRASPEARSEPTSSSSGWTSCAALPRRGSEPGARGGPALRARSPWPSA